MLNRIRRQLVGRVQGNGDSIGFYVNRYDDIVADFGPTVGLKYITPRPATSTKTLTASASLTKDDNGKTIIFDSTTSIIASLPSAAECKGCKFKFAWKQLTAAATGHGVSPVAADGVGGGIHPTLTSVVNKDLYSAQGTDAVTDRLTIESTGAAGTGAWVVTEYVGTFSKEA